MKYWRKNEKMNQTKSVRYCTIRMEGCIGFVNCSVTWSVRRQHQQLSWGHLHWHICMGELTWSQKALTYQPSLMFVSWHNNDSIVEIRQFWNKIWSVLWSLDKLDISYMLQPAYAHHVGWLKGNGNKGCYTMLQAFKKDQSVVTWIKLLVECWLSFWP